MSNVPATLFYFPTADALKGFHRFEVIQTHQVQGGGDSVALWAVTGYDRSSGQNTVLAEFGEPTEFGRNRTLRFSDLS